MAIKCLTFRECYCEWNMPSGLAGGRWSEKARYHIRSIENIRKENVDIDGADDEAEEDELEEED